MATFEVCVEAGTYVVETSGSSAKDGTVINSVARYRAIRARLPLSAVEKLATLDAVQAIRAADEAVTRDQPTGMSSGAPAGTPDAAGSRTVKTSEDDVPNEAAHARGSPEVGHRPASTGSRFRTHG